MNRTTPVIRCKIDDIAGTGNLMVVRSKFLGLFLITTYLLKLLPWSKGVNYCFRQDFNGLNRPSQLPDELP